jgi:hypothetical protein
VRARPMHAIILLPPYHLYGIYNNSDGRDDVIMGMSIMGI